jgi:hypothetical protein
MISVVMATLNCERDLAEALSPLVPASIDGLVHELVVSDAGSTDRTLEVLDEAGAVMVAGGLDAAAGRARGPWLLVMSPAARLGYDWIAPVRRRLQAGGGPWRLTRQGLFARDEALLVSKTDYLAGRRRGAKLKI